VSIKARERVEFPRARRVCYYVRMTPEAFWKAYVGDRSPREFLERRQGRSLRDFVDSYLSQVPHLYGIVQRGTWRETFAAVPQWRRDEVAVGLLSFLEAHREEWEGMETAPPPPVAEEAPAAPQPEVAQVETPPPPLTVPQSVSAPVAPQPEVAQVGTPPPLTVPQSVSAPVAPQPEAATPETPPQSPMLQDDVEPAPVPAAADESSIKPPAT